MRQGAKQSVKKKSARRTLVQLGSRGDMVRALVDTNRKRVEVKYRDMSGVKRARFFPGTPEGREEAIAWATIYHASREAERKRLASIARGEVDAKEPITLRGLWDAYEASPSFRDLRDKSHINYRKRFQKWVNFLGPDARPDETTLHDVDRYRIAATGAGAVLNSVRNTLNVVRIVYNWGQSRRLVTTNDMALHRWKTPKELPAGVTAGYEPGEYSPDEMDRMVGSMSPQRADQWRASVALTLMRHHGQRSRAVQHVCVRDFDLANDRIVWPGQYQKQGKDVIQPLTWEAYAAYLTAMYWRDREAQSWARRVAGARVRGKTGQFEHDPDVARPEITIEVSPWLIFARNDKSKPYSYSSLNYQVIVAEKRAGVKRQKYRAQHGFRRGRVGEIIDKTGDRMLGLEAVGDTDIKMLKSYDKRRQERIDSAFAGRDGTEETP